MASTRLVQRASNPVIPTSVARRDLAATFDDSQSRGNIPRRCAPRNDITGRPFRGAASIRFPTVCSLSLRFAAFLLLTAGCASSNRTTPAIDSVPFEIDDWKYLGQAGHQITSEHYEIYTTLNDEVLLNALPQTVETAYQFYRELVPSAREPKKRMPVFLFARRGEWAHFTRRLAGPRAQTLLKVRQGGYSERGVSVAEYVAHSVTFPLLTHEGFHQYAYHCVKNRVPAWLNEGLAVLCEGQRWNDTSLREFDPWLNPTRRNALAEALLRDETFPLEELLSINAGHVVGGSTRQVSTYYAQVWALMLFLREGADGKYAERFAGLLGALGSRDLEGLARPANAATDRRPYNFGSSLFRNTISNDLETVQSEYVAFMREKCLNLR